MALRSRLEVSESGEKSELMGLESGFGRRRNGASVGGVNCFGGEVGDEAGGITCAYYVRE